MGKVRIIIKHALWYLGLTKILPRQVINEIVIEECGDPIIRMDESERLFKSDSIVSDISVRKTVLELLKAAADQLPPDMCLMIVEGYRSTARQQHLWDARFLEVKRENPNAEIGELERITRLSVAKPHGVGGGHQTGGAVDITLCDRMGKFLDMGTEVQEFTERTPSSSKDLPPDVLSRRTLLIEKMHEVGFENYPGEWWHFSYGDQVWAAYGRYSKAIYGPM